MADPVPVYVPVPTDPALKVTKQGPTVVKKKKTAETEAALGSLDVADVAQTTALEEKKGAIEGIGRVDEQIANERFALDQQRQERRELTQTELGAEIQKKREEYAARQAAQEKAGNIEPLLTGWKAVLGGILQGLAQYSHTAAGNAGTAPGVEAWTSAIARDRQMKIDRYTRSKEFTDLAKNNLELAELSLRKRLADYDSDAIAAGNLLIKKADAMKAKFKTKEAAASVDITKTAIQSKQAELRAKMEADFGAQVTQHGDTVTESTQAPDAGAGKPTAASALGAGRSSLIVDAVKEAMAEPTVSTSDLRRRITNRARMGLGEQVKLGDIISGGRLTPAEGELDGVSETGKRAFARQSVLNETVTYLTTGAAATKDEAGSKTGQLMIQPSDSKETQRAKLVNTARYARLAADVGKPSMTPEHIQKLEELEAVLGIGGKGPASAPGTAHKPAASSAPSPGPGAVRKISSTRGPGWLLENGEFRPDSGGR